MVMRKALLVVVESMAENGAMSILTALVLVPLFLVAGLAPWWLAGRYVDTSTERAALGDLGVGGVVDTLRRGANMYVPAEFQNTRA